MSRTVKEWIGKTDDTPVPPRVRLRVFEKFHKHCASCGLSLQGKRWTCDHVKALINGGENRESNLQPLGDLCCNKDKNKSDVAEKSAVYGKKLFNAGIRKNKGRPMPGTRASGLRKRMDGRVERW